MPSPNRVKSAVVGFLVLSALVAVVSFGVVGDIGYEEDTGIVDPNTGAVIVALGNDGSDQLVDLAVGFDGMGYVDLDAMNTTSSLGGLSDLSSLDATVRVESLGAPRLVARVGTLFAQATGDYAALSLAQCREALATSGTDTVELHIQAPVCAHTREGRGRVLKLVLASLDSSGSTPRATVV